MSIFLSKYSIFLYISLINFISIPSSSEIYPINTLETYTWTSGYPQSCVCKENGASSSSCSYYQCTCICDLTAGVCDYGCCCDPDCSSSQISRFESLGVCKRDGTESDSVTYCYSSTQLAQINPRSPLSGESTAAQGVDQALCIYKKNAFFREDYYTDTDLQSPSIFSTSAGEKPYDYIESSPPATLQDFYYDQNNTITAYYDTSGIDTTFVSYGSGYWQIPMRDFSGYCNDFNLVLYEVDITPDLSDNGCIRVVPVDKYSFTQQCNGIWSLDYYVSRLKLATSSATLYTTVSNVPNISVSIISVSHKDFATGIVSSVNLGSWNVSSCGTSISSSTSTSSFENDCGYSISDELSFILNSSSSSLSSSSLFCRSVVQEVMYHVVHDDTDVGIIQSVTADIVIVDIPYSFITENQFQQLFSVYFSSDNTAGMSQSNGNLVPRKRSGNPGYVIGLPVLVGSAYINHTISSTNPIAISESIEGLTISSPFVQFDLNDPESFGKSLCPTDSQITNVETTPVKFGYDITTGCVLNLNRSQLIDVCCQGASCATIQTSPYSNPVTGIPYFFNFTSSYIGIYGNSDPLDISQWLKVSLATSAASREWVDKNSICYNMFTGLNYQFLVAKTGERTFPQNKIVAVSAEITSSNWFYRYPPTSAGMKQTFPLTITATFIYTNADSLKGYVPPAPPVLFSVPYDVFYPFQSSSGVSNRVEFYQLFFFSFITLSLTFLLYFL